MIFKYLVLSLMVTYAVDCYDEKFDKIDVEKLINDEAMLDSYISCMLDKGPCTADLAAEFKEIFPDVLSDGCAKCTPLQKKNMRKVFKAICEKKPSPLAELEKKYDPKGEYKSTFLSFIESTDK